MFRSSVLLVLATLLLCAASLSAQAQTSTNLPLEHASADHASGSVQISLDDYRKLLAGASSGNNEGRTAPIGYVVSDARLSVQIDDSAVASITGKMTISVFEDGWTVVPILPSGTVVNSVKISNQKVPLINTGDGLAWVTQRKGRYSAILDYRAEGTASGGGRSVPLPLPAATTSRLTVSVPGADRDLAIIPASDLEIQTKNGRTTASAQVQTSRGAMISWRVPSIEQRTHALSRADYRGQLDGDIVRWQADFTLETFTNEAVTLPLLSQSTALAELQLDGQATPIVIEQGHFAALVRGRGKHRIRATFSEPVSTENGAPSVEVQVPKVPVSRFELQLPGRKEVSVDSGSGVVQRLVEGNTVATVNVPMTSWVGLSWTEAVPETLRTETRLNASLYHAAYAEEGVLMARALVDIELNRGETSSIVLRIPDQVQINGVDAADGSVADWQVEDDEDQADSGRQLTVFFDRQHSSRVVLAIDYDRSLPTARTSTENASQDADNETPRLTMPLLSMPSAHRQRGMVALLSSQELTLEPIASGAAEMSPAVTRVGENQLPAFVREQLAMTVAHTFKYAEAPPELAIRASQPDRQQGRFDAQVDTLFSLGEVTLEASATVEIHVESGSLLELSLDLPAGCRLLSLAGPSVREHQVVGDDNQRVEVEFTQEMEGRFRLDLVYELVMMENASTIPVPTVGVRGAEVEQGRLAIEALSAVEVQPAVSEQLTAVDIAELPRQLILRTTNPILHAFKYVGDQHRLELAVTHHRVVEIKEAAIDRAHYRTLFTRDGMAVTRASFVMRNSREQFLRLELPAGSEVWSAFVDGRAEKPARSTGKGEDETRDGIYLIKIIHSTQGFPVEIVYQTPADAIRGLGTVSGRLPRPTTLVTETRWDVYLPEGVEYRRPTGDLELVVAGEPVAGDDLLASLGDQASASQAVAPLRPIVPAAGVHYAFEKLYANQNGQHASFAIPYAAGWGRRIGSMAALAGGIVLWLGIALLTVRRWRLGAALVASAIFVLAGLSVRYQVSLTPIIWISIMLLLVAAAVRLRRLWSGEHRPLAATTS